MSRTFSKIIFFFDRIKKPSLHASWPAPLVKVQWPPAFLSNENEKPELHRQLGSGTSLVRCRGVGLNEERENEKRGFETRKRPPRVSSVADKEAKNTKWGFAYNLLIRIGSASFFSQRHSCSYASITTRIRVKNYFSPAASWALARPGTVRGPVFGKRERGNEKTRMGTRDPRHRTLCKVSIASARGSDAE